MPPRPVAGLHAVDHISQSMHYEEMLTWLLFYTSLLDLEKLAEQDVLDPGGLVKSQVVQSADGSAAHHPQRLAIEPYAVLDASLPSTFGSGVQHIAFATDDLLRDGRQARGERRQRCCRSPRTTTTTSRPRPT